MKKFLILIAILLPVVCTGGFAAGIVTGLAWREARLEQARRVPVYVDAPLPAQPTPDIDAGLYAMRMQNAMAKSQNGMQQLQYLMASPAFDSPEWQRQVEAALAQLNSAAMDMRTVPVPPNVMNIHASVLELADEIDMFTANMRAGVQAGSFDSMGGAAQNMQNISRITAEMRAKMRQ